MNEAEKPETSSVLVQTESVRLLTKTAESPAMRVP